MHRFINIEVKSILGQFQINVDSIKCRQIYGQPVVELKCLYRQCHLVKMYQGFSPSQPQPAFASATSASATMFFS